MKANLLVAMLLLLSCSRAFETGDGFADVSFRVSSPEAGTKVTDASRQRESRVVRWAVFVFDTSSGWFRYGTSESPEPVILRLRAGRRYRCITVVNYPVQGKTALNPAEVTSAASLSERLVALSENAPDALQMYGARELVPGTGLQECELHVRRLVARLEVAGIALDCPQWEGKSFILRHIYLTNAYKTSRWGDDFFAGELSAGSGHWYNTLGWRPSVGASSSLDRLLGERDLDIGLDADHPHRTVHTFYFFPNPTPLDEDSHRTDSWCPRCTRLVLEATLDGETYYYPATLPPLGRNQVVRAGEIVIHGPGVSYPEGGTLALNVMDVDWDDEDPIMLD